MTAPMKLFRSVVRGCLLGVLLAGLASCQTVQYRDVLADFDRAVQAELADTESPFVDWYRGIATTLTDDYIARLDEKLRPTAWMLRGMSEWRSEQFAAATASAAKGQQEINRQKEASPKLASSRDSIVLTMLPGLVQDSRARLRLCEKGDADVVANYRGYYLPEFKAVLRQFVEAKQKMDAHTPAAVKDYWNYQCWRVLRNWSFTIGKLPVGEEATNAYHEADQIIASQFSSSLAGTNLASAIQAARNAIPTGHPYRRMIASEEAR